MRFHFQPWILLTLWFAVFIAFVLLCQRLSREILIDSKSIHIDSESVLVQKTHMILVWHWPFGNSFNLDGDFCQEKYGVPNCKMVDDHSRFPDADVVIFHNRELVDGVQMLPLELKRPQKQRWVWLTMESPENNGNVKPFAGYFNWTMTYHQDADIYSPYGFMVPKESKTDTLVEDYIPKNKTHLACWVVTNFSPNHKRTKIYQKLKDVIPIEVYGGKVGRRLDDNSLSPTISRCYFYLAFENSLFRDYISEKLWSNAYMSGAVPVVYGASRKEYEAVAERDSFIHVDDFSSVEKLGEFLKKVAQDKDAYASYFNWRLKYTIEVKHWVELACKFCPKISSMPPYKVYNDLDAWQR